MYSPFRRFDAEPEQKKRISLDLESPTAEERGTAPHHSKHSLCDRSPPGGLASPHAPRLPLAQDPVRRSPHTPSYETRAEDRILQQQHHQVQQEQAAAAEDAEGEPMIHHFSGLGVF